MESLATEPTPTPWPRMPSGQGNPFQNAPGPFIYALPNLAGTCPFSFSDTVLSCSFAADPTAPKHRHHHCYHHPTVTSRCHQDPPSSESAEPPSPAEERAEADRESSPGQSPLDESHFDLDDDISRSFQTEAGEATRQQQQQQQQDVERSSEPSTPTQSHTLSTPSPMGSEFPEGVTKDLENEKEEGEGSDGKAKRGRRCRKRRRRAAKGRPLLEHGGCVMGPRVMGLSGLHFDRWTRYVCPPALPFPLPPAPAPPAAMNHNPAAWLLTGYYGGSVPGNSLARYWDPMVQVPAGFVGVPSW